MDTDGKVALKRSAESLHAGELKPDGDVPHRPLVSVIIPAYNEAAMLWSTLTAVCRYMESLHDRYRWELIVVNDGSVDQTGKLAEEYAASRSGIRIVHHPRNLGLCQALKTGFNCSLGEYVVVLDSDLSYAPDHIEQLLKQIQKNQAKIVVASPYAKGGRVSDVPWLRHVMSVWANRFLSGVARCSLSTFTGMVRVYNGPFIRMLNLRSEGMEVSSEIIYKSLLLRAQIEEIPAHLDWKLQRAAGSQRTSSMKVMSHVASTMFTGFIFRPLIFFLLPGFTLLSLASYASMWVFIHVYEAYGTLTQYDWFLARTTEAIAQAYKVFPHTFIVAGLSAMLAIQLISLGLLSSQSKQYFEEVFNLGSTIYGYLREKNVSGNTRHQV
jgi:glycosyltransferase involved in cell wall biosynthesis